MATPPSSPVLRELEKIVARGYDARSVFDDWIALMFWALQRNDDEYLKIVRRYRNEGDRGKREIDYFCNAFSLVMQEMQKTNEETLGRLYMDWEVSKKYAAQFFTPWTVATMMAKMLGPNRGESIADCSCGSGVMIIAACREMTNEQLDETTFVGQDIDWTCVMMCALNFTFFNLNGHVIWGDALSNEKRRIFTSIRRCTGGSLSETTHQAPRTDRIPSLAEIATMKACPMRKLPCDPFTGSIPHLNLFANFMENNWEHVPAWPDDIKATIAKKFRKAYGTDYIEGEKPPVWSFPDIPGVPWKEAYRLHRMESLQHFHRQVFEEEFGVPTADAQSLAQEYADRVVNNEEDTQDVLADLNERAKKLGNMKQEGQNVKRKAQDAKQPAQKEEPAAQDEKDHNAATAEVKMEQGCLF